MWHPQDYSGKNAISPQPQPPQVEPDPFVEWLDKEITNAGKKVAKFKDADSDDEFSELNYYNGQLVILKAAKKTYLALANPLPIPSHKSIWDAWDDFEKANEEKFPIGVDLRPEATNGKNIYVFKRAAAEWGARWMREALEKELAELRTELKSLKRQPQALPIEEGAEKKYCGCSQGDECDMSCLPQKWVAERVLRVRDALVKKDYEEAYYWLYAIASPEFDKYYPWADLECVAGWPESKNEWPTPDLQKELSSLRTQLCNKLKDIEKLTEELGKAQEENEALKTKLQLNKKEGK
jgi:hypothetical protein